MPYVLLFEATADRHDVGRSVVGVTVDDKGMAAVAVLEMRQVRRLRLQAGGGEQARAMRARAKITCGGSWILAC